MKKILKWAGYGLLGLVVLAGVWVFSNSAPDISIQTMKSKYATSASKFMEIDGGESGLISVHYRDEGTITADSIPLVLIHGTGSSLFTWDGWVKELGGKFRIIRLDLPAYGLTGPNKTHDYSMKYYTQIIHELLTRLNVKQCYMAGNSLGGGVTWNYALAYPAAVKKMILIDAGGYPSKPKSIPLGFRVATMPIIKDLFLKVTPKSLVESSLKNVFYDDSKVTPQMVDTFWNMALREGNREAFVARMNQSKPAKSTTEKEAWEYIKTIKIPTLIQWGKYDGLIPMESAKRLHDDLANDTLIVYANAGHVPMDEIPVETARDAAYFLRKK